MNGVVGVIVNPIAGKDIRRLSTGASHTPDTTKMGIVRRVVSAAAESGATTLLLADDPHRLARRAIDEVTIPDGVSVELLSDHVSGTRRDTIGAAAEMRELGASTIIALGGDGTSRDVATGWPDAPLIPISTGTNNVYPLSIDGTSAGVAAGLVASGAIDIDRVAQPTKRILVEISDADGTRRADDVALVDLALVDRAFVGARAVTDPATLRSVVAAIGEPGSTGMSSIAGRAHPVDRHSRGGVFITIVRDGEPVTRSVRVPLSPGTFDTLGLGEIRPIDDGEPVILHGPGVLAFDGERDVPIGPGTTVTVTLERTGPRLIDVETTLMLAAHARLFDSAPTATTCTTDPTDPAEPTGNDDTTAERDVQETTDAH